MYACLKGLSNSPEGLVHRVFSVFIFNSQDQLLLHQCGKTKINFPLYWTNSCCSHPLLYETQEGIIEEAKDRTLFELGINIKQYTHSTELVIKVLYKAFYDEYWGEYELDYLIFITIMTQNIEINQNLEEINDVKWINRQNASEFVKSSSKISPWFKRIVEQTDFIEWWKLFVEGAPVQWDLKNIISLTGN